MEVGWNDIGYAQMLTMMTAHWPCLKEESYTSYEISKDTNRKGAIRLETSKKIN